MGRKGAGALQEEHRWGAPFWAQLSLLFRRSLRTRRFQVHGLLPRRLLEPLLRPPGRLLQGAVLCTNSSSPAPAPSPAPLQSMSIQDVILVAGVSLLSGLFWWQAGQDDTLVGCAGGRGPAGAAGPQLPGGSGAACTRAAEPGNRLDLAPLRPITVPARLPRRSARNTVGLLFFLQMFLSFRSLYGEWHALRCALTSGV